MCENTKADSFMAGLIKYDKGSKERQAYMLGHKEANELLLLYIDGQENKEVFDDIKKGAENVLDLIKQIEG